MNGSDPQTLIQDSKVSHDFQHKIITTSPKISPELKNENYIFIACPRNKDIVNQLTNDAFSHVLL